MANTYIVTNNKFKPYTFEEMLKPYQMYTEAYNKADTELNTLLEDAATKGFNFSPQDTAEAEAYNAILGRIQTASEQLATGLNPALSKEIQQLNKDYRKVMLPIQQKMAKRSELANEQRKLLSSNPDLRFTVDYSTASLDNITSSSSYGIINLDKIYKDTATEFAAKTSKMQRDDFDPTPIGSTGYYSVKTGYGYTPEEFEDAFYGNNGSPKTDSDIYKFYKEKVDAINARTDISNDIKIEMADAVYRGMEATAGKFSIDRVAGKTSGGSGKPNTKETDYKDIIIRAMYDEDPKTRKPTKATIQQGNSWLEVDIIGWDEEGNPKFGKHTKVSTKAVEQGGKKTVTTTRNAKGEIIVKETVVTPGYTPQPQFDSVVQPTIPLPAPKQEKHNGLGGR